MVHMFFEQIFFSNLPILTFGRKHYEFKIRSQRELGSKSQKEFVFPFAQSTINHRVIYDFGKRILQDFNEARVWIADEWETGIALKHSFVFLRLWNKLGRLF